MSTYKFIQCDICEVKSDNVPIVDGWNGWGSYNGILNNATGETEIHLCPHCMKKTGTYLQDLKKEIANGNLD